MVKIYKQPFAHGGDTIAIPDASQPDGKLSSTDGWTPDYQLSKTDPNYKPVGRQEMNGVFKEVTEALGQVQVQGAASWSADGAPYPINAQLYHNGKQWLALRANSVQPVEGADWAAIGTAATYDVGEASGQVMQVGAFGAGHTFTGGIFDANAIADQVGNKSGFYPHVSTTGSANVPYTFVYIQQLFHYDGNLTQIAYGYNTPEVWVRHRYSDVWSSWAKQLSTNDMLQATGVSTEFPMSQKAVSDLFASIQPQPSIAGSCTTNGTTDNILGLTGIVSALALETGDVIQITGSTGGLNDKLFTVESITDDNSIIVNYEHAGNRGNGSLKLADQTDTVTIKRVAKWYNAPVGLGQAWVNVNSFRAGTDTYTGPKNRTILVSAPLGAAAAVKGSLIVNGVEIAAIATNHASGTTYARTPVAVPSEGSYKRSVGNDYSPNVGPWVEMR